MNAKKIFQFSIGPVTAAGLSLITLPFVAWFFSVEDVGRLTMLQAVLGLSVSLFSLEMHQAYVREYHEEEDKAALFKQSFIPGLILFTFVALVSLILPFSISASLFGLDSELLTFLLFTSLLATFFINFLTHVIRMQERGLAFSATQVAPKILLLILVSLIMLLSVTADFKILILMNTLSLALSLFVLILLTKDTWFLAIRKSLDFRLLNRMLSFSLPLVAGGIAYWGLTMMDRFFLRSLSGFDELGVYALAVTLASVVSVMSSIFSGLWHPTLYRWAKNGVDSNRVQRVIENMVLVVAFIWSLAGLLSFIAPLFLPKQYYAIEYLIVACVVMPLFYLLSETTGVGIGLTRNSKYSMLASLIAFIVNAVLNYLLIPSYGASGAALASVIAFFVFFIAKTEFSALVWVPLARMRIYIICISYILATIYMVLTKSSVSNYYIVWLVLFILTCSLFSSRILELIVFCKTYLRERN